MPPFILLLLACLPALALAWLLLQNRRQGESSLLADLRRREQESDAELGRLREKLGEAEKETVRARTEIAEKQLRLDEERRLLELAEAKFKEVFESLASKTLHNSTEEFHKLVERTLSQTKGDVEGQLESRKAAVEEMVKPLKDQLEFLRRYSEDISKQQKGSEEGLREVMKVLGEGQERLAGETKRLSQALRSNQARGQWGEMVLEKILQWTGLKEGVHFEKQVHRFDEEKGAAVKPDFIVHLPGNRDVVIDSKAVLAAYIDAEGESDPQRKSEFMKQHARNVSATVDGLSRKAYLEQFSQAPDFVVLFMPADAFLFSALEVDQDLFERAFSKNVILATPSTLIPMLRIIERSWQVSSMADNAKEISRQGQELMSRFAVFWDHLGDLRGSIEGVNRSFNSAMGSLQSRVLPAARKLNELGVKSDKAAKHREIKPLETVLEQPSTAPAFDETLKLN